MPISHWTRERLYWTCQLGGWALAMAAWIGLAALSGGLYSGPVRPTPLQVAYGLALGYGACVGATHAIHVVATRRRWRSLPLRAFAPRLFSAVFAAAAAVQVLGYALSMVSEPWTNPHALAPKPWPSVLELASGTLMTGSIFSVWAVVYALAVTAVRLADAERDRLTLRASLAESRMRALEYQLNPHFLFNALNTVRALVRDEPEEARRAVTLLSGLLRQTLAAGQEATHSLARELDLVETYLALEGLRFDGHLQSQVDVPDSVRCAEVPALLVQTLVENAVKHGVARRRDGGEVAVSAHAEEDRLTIQVANPTPDAETSPLPDGTGTGLANARERLGLLFGDDAELDLVVGPERTTATVSLPLSRADDA